MCLSLCFCRISISVSCICCLCQAVTIRVLLHVYVCLSVCFCRFSVSVSCIYLRTLFPHLISVSYLRILLWHLCTQRYGLVAASGSWNPGTPLHTRLRIQARGDASWRNSSSAGSTGSSQVRLPSSKSAPSYPMLRIIIYHTPCHYIPCSVSSYTMLRIIIHQSYLNLTSCYHTQVVRYAREVVA